MSVARKLDSENDILLKLAATVSEHTGNQMGEKHLYLIRARLGRRMKALGNLSPAEYWAHFQAHEESEMEVLTSLLTTHHTFFFREYGHFEYLESEIPKILPELRAQNRKCIRIWSAACSRGQEVYSLAMFLKAKLNDLAPDFTFEIIGTDIDAKSVEIGKNGVYLWDELKSVPSVMMGNHWQRGTGEFEKFVRVRETIKNHCKFEVDNLLKLKMDKKEQFDFIFCRNVFIYFDSAQVETISQNLTLHLCKHGSLILGLSENLVDLKVEMDHVGRSVYKHKKPKEAPPAKEKVESNQRTVHASAPAPKIEVPKTLRIMCVDDSSTVLTLLKKSLNVEGFQVVATATNGLDAAQKLKTVQVDAMTLDIHMPEQNGVEYLKKNFGPGHPPVIMVSSVSADDQTLALASLSAGASDYVEKPTLGNLAQVSEQIRTKLKLAVQASLKKEAVQPNSLRAEFAGRVQIKDLDRKVRLSVAAESRLEDLAKVINQMAEGQPAHFIVLESRGTPEKDLLARLQSKSNRKIHLWSPEVQVTPDNVYFCLTNDQSLLPKKFFNRKMAALVFGGTSTGLIPFLNSWTQKWIGIEDARMGVDWRVASNSVIPTTSFAYDSTHWLAK